MIAALLGGSELAPTPRLRRLAQGAQLVVAADSGLKHARTLEIEPDLIVGDFDSVDAADLARFPSVPRVRVSPHKDQLDLELAIDAAIERGATRLRLLGVFGGRLDQSLAALLIAARLHRDGVPTTIHTADSDVHFLTDQQTLELSPPRGTLFSLLSLSEEVEVSTSGARYPLERTRLPFGVGHGVSNVALGSLVVRLEGGLLAVVVERMHR